MEQLQQQLWWSRLRRCVIVARIRTRAGKEGSRVDFRILDLCFLFCLFRYICGGSAGCGYLNLSFFSYNFYELKFLLKK